MSQTFSIYMRRLAGWLVHVLTASGACVGLLALVAIHQHRPILAFWWMGVAILIDGIDGCFARLLQISEVIPQIDGTLLDNIVDFFNYTLVPLFFLLVEPMVPHMMRWPCVVVITLASAYQFTHTNAKTADCFFLGFPSYWNIVLFYLFFWQTMPIWNMCVLIVLSILSFVPIKYVYPSRLEYLTHNLFLRKSMLVLTIIWGIATAGLLWTWPASHALLIFFSVSYLIIYITISLYRTWVPLQTSS